VARGNGVEYRCRVGHAYSPKSMLAEHYAAQEKALYAAVVALEEGAALANRLALRVDPKVRDDLRREALDRQTEADSLRTMLRERQPFCLD
jgi:two-component system chemotaxis response regulator CheB